MRRDDALLVAARLLHDAADDLHIARLYAKSRARVDRTAMEDKVLQASNDISRAQSLLRNTLGAATLPPRRRGGKR